MARTTVKELKAEVSKLCNIAERLVEIAERQKQDIKTAHARISSLKNSLTNTNKQLARITKAPPGVLKETVEQGVEVVIRRL